VAQPLSSEVRDEVEVMSAMGELKTWGGFDGGAVIPSDTPVNFQPSNKTSSICSDSFIGWPTTTSTNKAFLAA